VANVVSDDGSIPQVLNEIQAGEGLSLSAAGRLFPGHRGGKSVDPSTIFRWLTKGLKTPDARVVKLEAVRVGGRWLSSKGAVARFVSALTAAASPNATPTTFTIRTSTSAKRAAAAAAKLQRMGA
jgi:hypothetical protein